MSESCPDCGSAIEYASRPATVKSGHCASCGNDFTFLRTAEGVELPRGAVAGANGSAEDAEDDDAEVEIEETVALTCKSCGSEVELSLGAGGAIEATCSSCGKVERFVPEGTAPTGPSRDREGARAPWRGGGRPEGERPARPCRECGGPLKFTTLPDGMVQGKCESCGNEFVLPPREPRREYGGRSGGYRGGGRGGPRYDNRRERSGRPGGYDRRRGRPDRDDRPRRRRDSDE